MIHHRDVGLRWRALNLGGGDFASDRVRERLIERRLARILGEWEGTPYVAGQRMKKVGVFCTAFVASVLDELYRQEPTQLPALPIDISFHSKEGAMGGMRWFLRHYPNHVAVDNGILEPGDIVITGPVGGGPGHAMIVGPRENTIWEANGLGGVRYTGLTLADQYVYFGAFRLTDREVWI